MTPGLWTLDIILRNMNPMRVVLGWGGKVALRIINYFCRYLLRFYLSIPAHICPDYCLRSRPVDPDVVCPSVR